MSYRRVHGVVFNCILHLRLVSRRRVVTMYSQLKIDIPVQNLKFDRNVYEFTYTPAYHEGCDRMTIGKRDGTEAYTFDIFGHRQTPDEVFISWALPRKITRYGITMISKLDPDIWEFIEGGSGDDGPIFVNSISGGFATVDGATGKVKIMSRGHSPEFDPIKETRAAMRSNLYKDQTLSREPLLNNTKVTDSEVKARETLRDLISEKEWERYLSQGYMLSKGTSGKVYQIFANHKSNRIKVYENGTHVYNLCIHSEGVPDTDHVLSCMLHIQNDEDEFLKMCNKHEIHERDPLAPWVDHRYKNMTLLEILRKNQELSEKMKIPEDWIDVSVEKEEKTKLEIGRILDVMLQNNIPVALRIP